MLQCSCCPKPAKKKDCNVFRRQSLEQIFQFRLQMIGNKILADIRLLSQLEYNQSNCHYENRELFIATLKYSKK